MMLSMAKRKRSKAEKTYSPRHLIALRGRLAMTREQIAEQCGVSARTWMYYELGKQIPSRPVVLHIQRLDRESRQ